MTLAGYEPAVPANERAPYPRYRLRGHHRYHATLKVDKKICKTLSVFGQVNVYL
jgi:hypothetical protein